MLGNDLVQQSVHGAPNRGYQMQDVGTVRIVAKRALDRRNLTADAFAGCAVIIFSDAIGEIS